MEIEILAAGGCKGSFEKVEGPRNLQLKTRISDGKVLLTVTKSE